MNRKKAFLKFSMWFILLSTLGVGGGIFFLLFAVVPIEEWYVQRGWSQFKIDDVMSYYVVGWVVFGFIASFVYYYICLKKDRWIISTLLCLASIGLCIAGLNYFLNTGSAVVQASQGDVDVGERFTFGPYPEKETLQQLKDQGYDGIIALLSPTIGIEQPLLVKEQKAGAEVGIEILSMPMLPWVGDNTETLNSIQELAGKDGKRYYVHCYLGRHRVDVVKQLVNEVAGEKYELLVLQSTSFERGNLFYDSQNEVLIGPAPTDEEWFTRIRRGEVKEIVSLIDTQENFKEESKKVANEMNMVFTHKPLSEQYNLADLQSIVDYVQSLNHKVFVQDFTITPAIWELEALYALGKTIYPLTEVANIEQQAKTVGARFVIGPELTQEQQQHLKSVGVEEIVQLKGTDAVSYYKELKDVIKRDKLSYIVSPKEDIQPLYTMLYGLVYGYEDYFTIRDANLLNEKVMVDVRNLTYGPILDEQQIQDFIIPYGIKKVIFIYAAAVTSEQELQQIQKLYEKYSIDFEVFPMGPDYEKDVIPIINAEQGSNYLMVHEEMLFTVYDLLDKY